MLCGALPVAEALNMRGMKVDARCPIYGMDGENTIHVLFEYSYARQVWVLSQMPSPEFGFQNGSVFSNIQHMLSNRKNRD